MEVQALHDSFRRRRQIYGARAGRGYARQGGCQTCSQSGRGRVSASAARACQRRWASRRAKSARVNRLSGGCRATARACRSTTGQRPWRSRGLTRWEQHGRVVRRQRALTRDLKCHALAGRLPRGCTPARTRLRSHRLHRLHRFRLLHPCAHSAAASVRLRHPSGCRTPGELAHLSGQCRGNRCDRCNRCSAPLWPISR